MQHANRNHLKRALSWIGLAVLSLSVTGETCTKDRDVQVTVGAEVVATFEARGVTNAFDGERQVNVETDADIQQILDDNDFEGQVIAYIESAFVRVIRQDSNTSERTVTGSVTVRRQGDVAEQPLITGQSAEINDPALAEWAPVPLEASGVNLINEALQEYLLGIFQGGSPAPPLLVFHASGVSEPQGVESDFDWQVKVVMTLVGTKEITIIEPL